MIEALSFYHFMKVAMVLRVRNNSSGLCVQAQMLLWLLRTLFEWPSKHGPKSLGEPNQLNRCHGGWVGNHKLSLWEACNTRNLP